MLLLIRNFNILFFFFVQVKRSYFLVPETKVKTKEHTQTKFQAVSRKGVNITVMFILSVIKLFLMSSF